MSSLSTSVLADSIDDHERHVSAGQQSPPAGPCAGSLAPAGRADAAQHCQEQGHGQYSQPGQQGQQGQQGPAARRSSRANRTGGALEILREGDGSSRVHRSTREGRSNDRTRV